jgi:general secretion pathway protein M
MSAKETFDGLLSRYPVAAAAVYVVVIIVLAATVWAAIGSVLERWAAFSTAAELLVQLEGRSGSPPAEAATLAGTAPAGSPFLEGQTVTVAGAALLQRVTGAVVRVGGIVLSSQLELKGPQSRQGYISMTANCEMDHAALQPLLYDLEAGMPFLFVDQLAVQGSFSGTAAVMGAERVPMHVMVSVSGQWQAEK